MENIDLSEFAKTKGQANDFTARLSTISGKVFKNDFDLENVLLEEFGVKKRDKFMSLLRENKINTESHSDIKNFLGKLSEKVQSLPTLTLNIAFEPKEKNLKALSDWFYLNNKKQVLFELNVDPTLIAGATLTFEGKYVDFSIKERFSKIVKNVMTKTFEKKELPGQEKSQTVPSANEAQPNTQPA